jgi:hypothetical protein
MFISEIASRKADIKLEAEQVGQVVMVLKDL